MLMAVTSLTFNIIGTIFKGTLVRSDWLRQNFVKMS